MRRGFQVVGLNDALTTVGWTGHEALSTDRLPDTLTSSSAPSDCIALRPDLGIYRAPEQCGDALPSSVQAHGDARVAWSSVEVLAEVKWNPRGFPFSSRHTPRSTFLPSGRERCLSRGQLVEYALEVFNRQHRQAVFLVLFLQDCARFVRFDRSNAVVSEEFDYTACPEIIATFLYRLSKMSLAERGYDPTALRACQEEEIMFRSLHAKYPEGSATRCGLLRAAPAGWPVYKLTVDAAFSPNSSALTRDIIPSRRHFLVGKPAYVGGSLVGPGTRTFVAYDLATGQVVYLKDTWRVDSPEVPSELETYLHLRENATGELYIPTLLGGGDVLADGKQQRTDAAGAQEGRVHARLIFKEICRPLEDFTNAFELVKCVTWALVGECAAPTRAVQPHCPAADRLCLHAAHAKAWRDCGLLHRNISTDSILIYDAADSGMSHPVTSYRLLADWEPSGACHVPGTPHPATTSDLLADWEFASPLVHDPGGAANRLGSGPSISHSNSWPFVSAHLQERPEAPHELADDLESFVHVLNFCALKHLSRPDELSSEELQYLLQAVYHAVVPPSNSQEKRKGSPLKLEKVQNGTPFVKGLPDGHPMGPLLSELSRLCKTHYDHTHPPSRTGCTDADELSFGDAVYGLHCGMPDLDIGPLGDESYGEANLAIHPPVAATAPDPALSPLRDHSPMVNACMRAIRKVWPRADRVQRETRLHRTARKRTCQWSTDDLGLDQTSAGHDQRRSAYKRARRSASATAVNGGRVQVKIPVVRRRGSAVEVNALRRLR